MIAGVTLAPEICDWEEQAASVGVVVWFGSVRTVYSLLGGMGRFAELRLSVLLAPGPFFFSSLERKEFGKIKVARQNLLTG